MSEMSSWQGQSKGNRLGYRIFVYILRKCGVFPAYFLLRFVALYYFFFSGKASHYILQYYHKLGYSKTIALRKLYRNYYLFGQALIDKVVLMAGIPNRFTFNFDGEAYLHDITQKGKGGLLLSAHLGNWEIAGHLLKRLNTRINIVMYDGEHQKIKEYLDEVTGGRNMNVIVIKEDASHIYAINEALSNNELVCIHADRFIEGNKTIEYAFLGTDARFPLGPFLLAATFKVPVSFVYACKESATHYHFYASAPKQYDNLLRKEAIQTILADYVAGIEVKARQYPEQWFNYYDFWKQEDNKSLT